MMICSVYAAGSNVAIAVVNYTPKTQKVHVVDVWRSRDDLYAFVEAIDSYYEERDSGYRNDDKKIRVDPEIVVSPDEYAEDNHESFLKRVLSKARPKLYVHVSEKFENFKGLMILSRLRHEKLISTDSFDGGQKLGEELKRIDKLSVSAMALFQALIRIEKRPDIAWMDGL